MPVMDGLEATRFIRASGSDIPIVAITANDASEDIDACFEAGMNDHAGKPIKFKEIIKIINYHWPRSGA
jgi:CheY-like chemotaxis protein